MEKLQITKEEISELPLGEFQGKIEIVDSPKLLHYAIDELNEQEILGFDTETKPTFKKGQYHKVALVQLAFDHKAYLFRLNKIGFDDRLRELMANEILKVGVGLRDDIRALRLLSDFEPGAFVDLNQEVKKFGVPHEGAKNLTALFLGFRISKAAQISNWESDILTEKQLKYAATDAWICHQIYLKMRGI
jgi:ribonuclease D